MGIGDFDHDSGDLIISRIFVGTFRDLIQA